MRRLRGMKSAVLAAATAGVVVAGVVAVGKRMVRVKAAKAVKVKPSHPLL